MKKNLLISLLIFGFFSAFAMDAPSDSSDSGYSSVDEDELDAANEDLNDKLLEKSEELFVLKQEVADFLNKAGLNVDELIKKLEESSEKSHESDKKKEK